MKENDEAPYVCLRLCNETVGKVILIKSQQNQQLFLLQSEERESEYKDYSRTLL